MMHEKNKINENKYMNYIKGNMIKGEKRYLKRRKRGGKKEKTVPMK